MSILKRGRHAVAAATVLSCLTAAADLPSPARFLPLSKSVVRVVAARDGGGVSVGSGVTVAPSIVATSCHVIRDAGEIRISGGGGSWEVDAEQSDVYRDVCLLRAPSWTGTPVDLAAPTTAPEAGEAVVALGFTGGAPIKPNFGRIRALHPFEGGGHIIEADAPFNSGSSGGGLFAADGKLIGLLTFRLRNSVDSYYSVPVEWVRERLVAGDGWAEVRPLPKGVPFWQGEREHLPPFMRTGALASRQPGA